MACGCHGKKGDYVGGGIKPDDQCTACALKHINHAKELWGEFQHTADNRFKVAGHLRLAVDHLKYDHIELALRCRNVAMIIEYAQDDSKSDIRDKLSSLFTEATELFYADNPEAKERFEKLTKLPQ